MDSKPYGELRFYFSIPNKLDLNARPSEPQPPCLGRS
jgi:hypothetical protein